MISNFVV